MCRDQGRPTVSLGALAFHEKVTFAVTKRPLRSPFEVDLAFESGGAWAGFGAPHEGLCFRGRSGGKVGAMGALLEVAKVGDRSSVVAARAQTPLALLNPANHGHAAWVFQSSHGGGFVTGDAVELTVRVLRGASLFLSSQASSKAYRGTHARFTLDAQLEPEATLVSWPDPVSCFSGARLTQLQRFACAQSANLVVVDAYTAGRLAHGERWAFERLESRLELDVEQAPAFREALLLSDALGGPLAARLGEATALATVLLTGPRLQQAIEALAQLPGASRWPHGLVLRFAEPTVEALHDTLRRNLREPVADLLGDDPHARKW